MLYLSLLAASNYHYTDPVANCIPESCCVLVGENNNYVQVQ